MTENGTTTTAAEEESTNWRIDLFFTPHEITEERLKAYNVVVMDVLRAATSITTALANGAKYVIPAPSIAEATALAAQLSRDNVLLCGEREGKLIDGFDVGNSPADYSRDRVRGRHLIFGSTNGSPAIVKASGARGVFLCGFVNLNAVLDAVLASAQPFPLALLCAGRNSRFSIEDAVCGGMMITRLRARNGKTLALNDAACTAEILARDFSADLPGLLSQCDHGKYLKSLGMESDLPLCAADSSSGIVPVLKDGRLVKYSKG
jgi:2-phosphosulfolactate phosphatase